MSRCTHIPDSLLSAERLSFCARCGFVNSQGLPVPAPALESVEPEVLAAIRERDAALTRRASTRVPVTVVSVSAVVLVLVIVIAVATSGGSSSTASGDSGPLAGSVRAHGCESPISVGDTENVTIDVTNTSNTRWPATFVQFDGTGPFVQDQLTDDADKAGEDMGADEFQFGGLEPGQTRTITGAFTAKAAGNTTLAIWAWGDRAGEISTAPGAATAVSCDIAIDP